MEPIVGDGPFDDPGYRFEPWWPGTRVLVTVSEGTVRLDARHLADPLTAFPEMRAVADLVPRIGPHVLDGALLVLDGDGRPDSDLLRERLSWPEVRDGTPAFVASDLLMAAGVDLTQQPFRTRLERLVDLLQEADWCMVARGYEGEGLAVAQALESMGLTAMSARHLDSRYRAGPSRGAWLRLPLRPSEPPTRPPTLALIQRLGL
ncbi:MAG: hypothetical protein ACHQZR_06825 [Candidatus Limnocylindrales bacterium]